MRVLIILITTIFLYVSHCYGINYDAINDEKCLEKLQEILEHLQDNIQKHSEYIKNSCQSVARDCFKFEIQKEHRLSHSVRLYRYRGFRFEPVDNLPAGQPFRILGKNKQFVKIYCLRTKEIFYVKSKVIEDYLKKKCQKQYERCRRGR